MKKNPVAVGYHKCSYVSNDHPPMCMHELGFDCFKCEQYIDGVTDLLPWDNPTEDQKALKALYKERDDLYASMDPIYKKIHALVDPINVVLRRVRKAHEGGNNGRYRESSR